MLAKTLIEANGKLVCEHLTFRERIYCIIKQNEPPDISESITMLVNDYYFVLFSVMVGDFRFAQKVGTIYQVQES